MTDIRTHSAWGLPGLSAFHGNNAQRGLDHWREEEDRFAEGLPAHEREAIDRGVEEAALSDAPEQLAIMTVVANAAVAGVIFVILPAWLAYHVFWVKNLFYIWPAFIYVLAIIPLIIYLIKYRRSIV